MPFLSYKPRNPKAASLAGSGQNESLAQTIRSKMRSKHVCETLNILPRLGRHHEFASSYALFAQGIEHRLDLVTCSRVHVERTHDALLQTFDALRVLWFPECNSVQYSHSQADRSFDTSFVFAPMQPQNCKLENQVHW